MLKVTSTCGGDATTRPWNAPSGRLQRAQPVEYATRPVGNTEVRKGGRTSGHCRNDVSRGLRVVGSSAAPSKTEVPGHAAVLPR